MTPLQKREIALCKQKDCYPLCRKHTGPCPYRAAPKDESIIRFYDRCTIFRDEVRVGYGSDWISFRRLGRHDLYCGEVSTCGNLSDLHPEARELAMEAIA